MQLAPDIRIAVRALIARDERVLVQRKVYEDGTERFALPGGAPNIGETLVQGLQRECGEEIGSTVEVLDLIHVADYFKLRDTVPPTHRQQVEFVFRCRVPQDYIAHNGPHPDKHQREVLWLETSQLCHKSFFPQGLRPIIAQRIPNDAVSWPVYLGLIE